MLNGHIKVVISLLQENVITLPKPNFNVDNAKDDDDDDYVDDNQDECIDSFGAEVHLNCNDSKNASAAETNKKSDRIFCFSFGRFFSPIFVFHQRQNEDHNNGYDDYEDDDDGDVDD